MLRPHSPALGPGPGFWQIRLGTPGALLRRQHTPPTLSSNLLSVSPTPACTLFFFFFALLPAVLLLPLLPVPQLPPLLLRPSPCGLSLPPPPSPPLWLSPLLWATVGAAAVASAVVAV